MSESLFREELIIMDPKSIKEVENLCDEIHSVLSDKKIAVCLNSLCMMLATAIRDCPKPERAPFLTDMISLIKLYSGQE